MRKCFLIFLIYLLVIFLPIFLFRFERIECISKLRATCSSNMLDFLSHLSGKRFFDISFAVRKSDFLSDVAKYRLDFLILSREVRFLLEENNVFVAIASASDSFWMVDTSGRLVEKVNNRPDVLVVEVESFNYQINEKVPDDLLLSLWELNYLRTLYGVEKGIVFTDRIEVLVKDGPTLILPREKDYKKVLGRARFLLDSLAADFGKFKLDKSITYITIDLRYKNPVLR